MMILRSIKICSLLLLGLTLKAQDVRLEKDYDRTFDLKPGGKVEISNKYGEVIIHSANDRMVRIKVKVTATGKNQETVNKTISRVDIDYDQVGSLITAKTRIEQRTGGLKLLDDISDYSKGVLGTRKLQVDYEVWLPDEVGLAIVNKYGDIFLGTLKSQIEVTLAHGDLRADRIEERIELEHSYGKSRFDYIKFGKLELKAAEVQVDKGSSIHVRSSSSTIDVSNMGSIHLNSRNDKVRIDGILKITGSGRFTDIYAQGIVKTVSIDFEYGEIDMNRIEQNFETIKLIGKSTDINLVLNQASFFNANIRGREDRMIVPNSMLSLQRSYDPETKNVTLVGDVGYTQAHRGNLIIDADGGDVIISIRETPIYTDKD